MVDQGLGPKSNKVLAYGIASVSGTILAVCSCTVLPLFAGIYTRGAGIGPASAFLYSGPAVNVLPYEADMEKEMLCRLTLSLDIFASVPQKTVIHLPRFDINALTRDTVFKLLQGYERRISPYFLGDIRRTSLSGIWNSAAVSGPRASSSARELTRLGRIS
jgi:hypothetical protein